MSSKHDISLRSDDRADDWIHIKACSFIVCAMQASVHGVL